MARQKISQRQRQGELLDNGLLDLLGEEKKSKPVKFENIKDTLEYVAAKYVEEIRKAIEEKDVISSGALAESVEALQVDVKGSVYTVEIQAKKYLSYVDEGVDGWAKSRGSKYKFKTKGVNPDGEMVKSVLEWLTREGAMSSLKAKPVTKREKRRAKITDTSKRAAITAAFMIKKQGIKPKKFMKVVKKNMDKIIKEEFGNALKLDIINNLV